MPRIGWRVTVKDYADFILGASAGFFELNEIEKGKTGVWGFSTASGKQRVIYDIVSVDDVL